jgi:hypothetical protein
MNYQVFIKFWQIRTRQEMNYISEIYELIRVSLLIRNSFHSSERNLLLHLYIKWAMKKSTNY